MFSVFNVLTTVCTLAIHPVHVTLFVQWWDFLTAQVAIDVFCLCLGPDPVFLLFYFGCWFWFCMSRYALLAWGSAFRLDAIGSLFLDSPPCLVQILAFRFPIYFDVQY